MPKIKAVQTFVSGDYVYLIDEDGQVWKRTINDSVVWLPDGELPEKTQRESTAGPTVGDQA